MAAALETPACGAFGSEFLAEINAAREGARLQPLTLSPELCRAAQARAQEIGAQGNLDRAVIPGQDLLERAERGGYRASALSQLVVQAEEDPAAVVDAWRLRDDTAWKNILRPRHRDLGVGAAWLEGVPLYVLFFGVSNADAFASRTRDLRDPARVRGELLASVNRERRKKKLPPLRANPVLETAAQRHADDMLARGYYGHASPEGTLVMRRVRRAGYEAERVGENIAKGQGAVEEAMDGWMRSREHRENILDPFFVDAGFGIALGKMPEGDQVLWVQVFGRQHGR